MWTWWLTAFTVATTAAWIGWYLARRIHRPIAWWAANTVAFLLLMVAASHTLPSDSRWVMGTAAVTGITVQYLITRVLTRRSRPAPTDS